MTATIGRMTTISISLSGGGHRASLFGLGALMYLVDAGKGREVSSVASVSGGSITNAFVAYSVDIASATSGEFRERIKPLTHQLARKGTLFAAPLTKVYLVVVALAAAAAFVLPWWVVSSSGLRALWVVSGFLFVTQLAALRGWICGRAFATTLFAGGGREVALRDIRRPVDHVICATDLHAGEHVYFSGRFVCSYRFGWGQPGDLPLHVAVQASAALPGAFPARWIRTRPHEFRLGAEASARNASTMVLVDGGVYDNMGDQWAQGISARARRWASLDPALIAPDELVVVNASASMSWRSAWSLRLPVAGEILALLRDKDVLYDNGTSVRRQALVARFELAERDGTGIRGALVHIPQSPLVVARAFASSREHPQRATRARAVLRLFEVDEQEWKQIASQNARFKTTLSRVGEDATARLLYHGYALAMANLHVVLGYPLLELPPLDHFQELAG